MSWCRSRPACRCRSWPIVRWCTRWLTASPFSLRCGVGGQGGGCTWLGLEERLRTMIRTLPSIVCCVGGGRTRWHAGAMHLSVAQVHDQVFPTVYTLWRYPNAVPYISTYSEVSPKVCEQQPGCPQMMLADTELPCKATSKRPGLQMRRRSGLHGGSQTS